MDSEVAVPAPEPVATGTLVSGEKTIWLLTGEVG